METLHDPLSHVKERLSAADTSRKTIFRLMERDFWVNPGVFPPNVFLSTTFFSQDLQYPVGGSFWEVGCGTGVTSVIAALRGCKRVLASDISPEAADNAQQNVRLHAVSSIVTVRCGDLFDVLCADEKFDVIYWNSNFVHVPETYVFEKDIHKAFADAGYKSHSRFLKQAPKHLEPGGRIFLGFSSQGNSDMLAKLLSANGYASRVASSRTGVAPGNYARFEIVELTPL
jgi:methylase of polypeptide subunit release factors